MKKLFEFAKKFLLRLFEHRIIRYLFTGGVLFLIDLAVFKTLRHLLGMQTLYAQWISRTVGASIGFIAQKVFVFQNKDNRAISLSFQGLAYLTLTVVNIFLSGWLLFGIEQLSLKILKTAPDLLIKVPNEVIMVMWTYLVTSQIFKQRKDSNDET